MGRDARGESATDRRGRRAARLADGPSWRWVPDSLRTPPVAPQHPAYHGHFGALLSSDDYGSRVERDDGCHPVHSDGSKGADGGETCAKGSLLGYFADCAACSV